MLLQSKENDYMIKTFVLSVFLILTFNVPSYASEPVFGIDMTKPLPTKNENENVIEDDFLEYSSKNPYSGTALIKIHDNELFSVMEATITPDRSITVLQLQRTEKNLNLLYSNFLFLKEALIIKYSKFNDYVVKKDISSLKKNNLESNQVFIIEADGKVITLYGYQYTWMDTATSYGLDLSYRSINFKVEQENNLVLERFVDNL